MFKSVTNASKKCSVIPPTFEEIMTENYKNLFDIAFKGGDLGKVTAVAKNAYTELGLNTDNMESWGDSFKAFIKALKSNSGSECDRKELRKVIDDSLKSNLNWIRSQPGLSDFPECSRLREDPRNDEFFAIYEELQGFTDLMVQDPAWALTTFNAETAAANAHFDKLVAEVSKRAVIGSMTL